MDALRTKGVQDEATIAKLRSDIARLQHELRAARHRADQQNTLRTGGRRESDGSGALASAAAAADGVHLDERTYGLRVTQARLQSQVNILNAQNKELVRKLASARIEAREILEQELREAQPSARRTAN